MNISLEVSQKLKAMKNDWYFIGFFIGFGDPWQKVAKPLQRGRRFQGGPNAPSGKKAGTKQCTITLQALRTKKDI